MNGPTPHDDLNHVLARMVEGIDHTLGDACLGVYLQGSLAIGDFDAHSDVDFIVAVQDEIAEDMALALSKMHEKVYAMSSEWAKHLEGSYFPADMLRDHRRAGEPLWYLDHGSQALERSDHCNTSIVRWVVRERGITLAGPDPTSLVNPVPVDVMQQEMASTIITWGEQILREPDEYRNRFYQGFIVLNYCRMLHDLVAGQPSSKRVGAEWAKQELAPEWAPLIDRAWGCRPHPAVSVREPADPTDFTATLGFVELIIGLTRVQLAARDD